MNIDQQDTENLNTDVNSEVYLDAKGLNCPLPILKTKLALTRMADGETILVDSTDPHSEIDFRAYCARIGHQLLEVSEDQGIFRFLIKKTGQTSHSE